MIEVTGIGFDDLERVVVSDNGFVDGHSTEESAHAKFELALVYKG